MKNEAPSSRLDLDYKPKLPRDRTIGIGIVGAGAIVEACHLPAYRMAGFRVVGLYDIDRGKADRLAEAFGIAQVFASLEELLDHPDIQVVDIAVPARYQPDIVEQAAGRGKHILCQKPLGETYEDAKRIAEIVRRTGVKAAVNQQMRWSPGIRASHTIRSRGWLGEILQASIQVNVLTEWEQWPWITQIEHLEIMYHSIHYLDAIRFVVGRPPLYVYADAARFPGQVSRGETRTLIHLAFSGETRGLVHDNHNNIAEQDDWYATFRFEGTEGTVKGTNGALYNYPQGREDTIAYMSRLIEPNCWIAPRLEGRWFPHAFMGTMGELLRAIEEEREPENSVEDNLHTMRTVFAAYRSIAENRPVWLNEFP
jgi:predicted dehydrogenase